QYYREILQEHLLRTLKDIHVQQQQVMFQQDNDLKHTLHIAWDWFSAKSIAVLPWPAQSPDSNIMKNLWIYVDQKVHSCCVLPKSM
ncbi:hypothetical protein BDV93DRAFT_399035, partial [Ceratobasidium sp. AG-I]